MKKSILTFTLLCSTITTVAAQDISPSKYKFGAILSTNIFGFNDDFEPNGQKLKEGEIAKLKVKRNNEFITLDVVVKYGMKEKKHVLRWMKNK